LNDSVLNVHIYFSTILQQYISINIQSEPCFTRRTSTSSNLYLSLNFIYFTTITKQVIQLILIMLVGIDVRMVFVWEETGVLGGNPPV